MKPEHHLTVTEIGQHLKHKSRLALLVLPLFAPGLPEPTSDFSREFADAFNIVFLQEGNPVFDFMNNLNKPEKDKVINLLIQGGMAGSTYISGGIYLVIPTDVQLNSPNNGRI